MVQKRRWRRRRRQARTKTRRCIAQSGNEKSSNHCHLGRAKKTLCHRKITLTLHLVDQGAVRTHFQSTERGALQLHTQMSRLKAKAMLLLLLFSLSLSLWLLSFQSSKMSRAILISCKFYALNLFFSSSSLLDSSHFNVHRLFVLQS